MFINQYMFLIISSIPHNALFHEMNTCFWFIKHGTTAIPWVEITFRQHTTVSCRCKFCAHIVGHATYCACPCAFVLSCSRLTSTADLTPIGMERFASRQVYNVTDYFPTRCDTRRGLNVISALSFALMGYFCITDKN